MGLLIEILGILLSPIIFGESPTPRERRRARRDAAMRAVLGVGLSEDITQAEHRNRLRELGYDVDS